MVVCKYFLQGCCRFGDSCKFEHQINDTYNSANKLQHNSVLWQSQFGSNQYQYHNPSIYQKINVPVYTQNNATNAATTSTNVDTDTLIKSVINDMAAVERGGQWLLSCYGPFKEKPIFPGFDDYCFEEIRSYFYEAIKNGTVEQYKQQILDLIQQAKLRIASLQKPTADIVDILKNIYNTPIKQVTSSLSPVLPNSAVSQSPISTQNTTTNSIFAQTNQSIFGKPTAQAAPLPAGTTNIFGGNQSSQQITPSPNTFAQANANFNAQNNNSIFGNQQGNVIAPTPSNWLSQEPNWFSQDQKQPGIFANQSGNIFQQQNTTPTGFFNNQSAPQITQQSLQAQPNLFGRDQNLQATIQQQSIFSPQNFATSTPQTQNTQNNTLGNQPSFFQTNTTGMGQNSNIFGTQPLPPPDETLYSKLQDLTEEEVKWFQSDDVTNLRIPEKPPTYEMCFKTM